MNAEQFQTMSIIAFVCMAIFLIAAAIMFFVFDIPAIIGEISGKTAAKQVAQIREQNKRPTSRQKTINGYENMLANSGKSTEPLKKERKPIIPGWTSTQPLAPKPVVEEGTALLDEGTALLEEGTALLEEGTALLDEGTALLTDETALLVEETEEEGTTLLGDDNGTVLLSEVETQNDNFFITQNVVMIHTNERI